MRLTISIATLTIFARVVAAQPGPDPVPPDQPPPPPAMDEDKVREIVDREVARIIAEREARLAAEKKAADERAATERPPTDHDGDYLSGGNGVVDVRLAMTLTNENIFVEPGETIPSVPGWRFGRPNSLGVLFFDNYDTRFSGFETLDHQVLYKNYRKDHLEVEAGLVTRQNVVAERRIDFSDAGSYILVSRWKDPTHTDPTRISFTAFPVSGDRFRLGYSYRLSWGGNDEFRPVGGSALPAVKLQYDFTNGYVFAGAKSAVTLDKPTAEQKSQFSFLAGGGIDVNEMIRIEANGGVFDKGSNEQLDVQTEDVQMFGASAQVAVHQGMPVQSSVDYKLYRYDPERIGRVFQKQKYPGGLAWLAMLEGTIIGQTLKDPEMTGSTKIQYGAAGDVNVRVLMDRIRLRGDVSYRDLAFILHTLPSLPSYQDFSPAYEVTPNLFASVGVDKNWNDKLTLGVIFGIDLPATLTTPSALPGLPPVEGESTAVVRLNQLTNSLLITILPRGEQVIPAYATKLTAQYDFGEVFSTIAELYFVYDGNTSRLTRNDPEGLLEFQFGEFNQLGMNFTLLAKF